MSNFKKKANDFAQGLKSNSKSTFTMILISFALMIFFCLVVFFASVRGAEKVMVPSVQGLPLVDALLAMQEKELYAEIILKHSELPFSRGTVIAQNPQAGSIVKAYRKVTLTIIYVEGDTMEDFLGFDVNNAMKKISSLLENYDEHITVASPVFLHDTSPKGTVIAQFPKAGSEIKDGTKIQLVASAGVTEPFREVPNITGNSIKETLFLMQNTDVAFDFTIEENEVYPTEGKIISQTNLLSTEKFARVSAVLGIKPRNENEENEQGLFYATLPQYPYPVPLRLDSQDKEGNKSTLISFNHPGKNVTIPYDVKKGSTLLLYVLDNEAFRVSL